MKKPPSTMKFLLPLVAVISSSLFVTCSAPAPEQSIVHPGDYAIYLDRKENRAIGMINKDMNFWKDNLAQIPNGETYRGSLAGLYSARFALNGKIEDIFTSDSLYREIQKNTKIDYSYVHRALAANCITQHKFREAKSHIDRAIAIGDGKAASLFMLVDVDVELGDLPGAKRAMENFTNHNFFPWLIREAKIQDHGGHLDSAIIYMEKALKKVETIPASSLWTLSNLADMYGHAGRLKEAYAAYLKVLKIDPDYDYALKGIAWLAFSHDHNNAEAAKIAAWISTKRATPDMHLFLAQIAAADGNTTEKVKQLEIFINAAKAPKYGDMYNKYLALLDAEELKNPMQTITIAQREIHNRPTPQSFDLLAWGYYNTGNFKEALKVAEEHIIDHTWEPEAYYHLGMILKANGMDDEARAFFEKAATSYFELGPEKAEKIRTQLSS